MNELFPFYSIGHFINQPENPTGFEIVRFEQMQEPEVEETHKHSFYEIIWVETGTSYQTIDYQTYRMEAQSLFFISPGQLHRFEAWEQLSGGSIFFTEEFFLFDYQNKEKLFELSFLDNFYSYPYLQPDAQSYREIKNNIDQLYAEKQRADYSLPLVRALLHVLLLRIQRCIDAQVPQTVPKKYLLSYKMFKNLLDLHFKEQLSAGDYARKLHITLHHLNYIVKQITGKTATEVIRGRLMLEARRLLSFSDAQVAEIAARLGCFDASYFSRQFRAETGLSPLEFRQRISQ